MLHNSKNKASSHVGMILSFVIFVTFLLVLYTIFQPSLKLKETKKQELEFIKEKILTNISEQITYVTYSYELGKDCVKITPPENLDVINFSVKLQDGTNSNSELVGQKIHAQVSSSRLIKVIYGRNFSTTATPTCKSFNDAEEEFSQTRYEAIEENIINIINEHRSNYASLKTSLDIAEGTEFGIIWDYENGTKIESKKVQEGNNVFAENIPVQYLNTSADMNRGILTIQIW